MKSKPVPGRPSAYKSEYCDQLIKHMEQGFSYESFAGSVGVSKQTIYDWEKAHPEFLDAKEIVVEKSRIFWEKIGIDHVVNISESSEDEDGNRSSSSKSLNPSVWIFNMKNRFKWRDKQPDEVDTVVNNIMNASDEDVDRRLAELLKKVEAK